MQTLIDFREPKEEETPYTGEYAMGVNETCDELRKEAIKWVKELRKEGYDKKPKIETIKDASKELTRLKLECETDIIERWIMHFFNITEEELK